MTTRTRLATYVLVAVVAVTMATLGAVAGLSGSRGADVDRTASEHGSGTHTMTDGSTMSDTDMHGMHDMPGMDGGLALWATQTAGGKVLVLDGDGRPFYRSDADGSGPACAGACAAEWEPVTVAGGETPDLLGVQRSDVGTVRRADGTTQLTLGGAPLYRRAGPAPAQPDPAEFAGRGWFAVSPTGAPVGAA